MFETQRRERLKASGNLVLGRVPDEWGVVSMRSLVASRSQRGRADLPLLSVARERGVFVRSADDDNHNVIPEDLSNYKVAREGDLVINKMKAWQGSLGLAPVDGIVSPAYFVFEFRLENRHFGERLLRSAPYVEMLGAASDGVRVGQWDLDMVQFRALPVPIPSKDEQAAIVKYLGHAHARIDRAIAAKRKLIALLEEQKQAILHQAITRGLDPDVPLKDSGIPWLGPIPAHWEAVRVKQVIQRLEQGWSPQCDAQPAGPGEWGVLKVGCTNYGRFRADQNKRLPPSLSPRPELEVRHGDLLVSRANTIALVGSAAVALNPPPQLLFSDKTLRIRPKDGQAEGEFLALALSTQGSRDQIESGAVGASDSMQNIAQAVITDLWISLPPPQEQNAIVAKARSEALLLEQGVSHAGREIALLQEFRTRLTSDVVTGQVDVREIAATLPDLTDEQLAEVDEPTDPLDDAEQYLEEAAPE